ncbi:MAG: ATP-binding cassette domain-containing protein, partial [Desulfosalsimonadaceae bacterium]|nr:ATP-binding cassette domain-containing protein [Desulfosalsimonadaceae bacterium]
QHSHLFSVIFDDFHLFDRCYGLKDIDPARVKDLIAMMELSDKVSFEDNRFSRQDLSTGQRKRLALITTILEDKPVYVFDEWASDQSPLFREYFYYKLLPSFKAAGKTVIAVTHDERFFHAADRLFKLDYGKLAPVVRELAR